MKELISRLCITTKFGVFYSDWEETSDIQLAELTSTMENLFFEPFGSLNMKINGDTVIFPEALLSGSIIAVESSDKKDLPF